MNHDTKKHQLVAALPMGVLRPVLDAPGTCGDKVRRALPVRHFCHCGHIFNDPDRLQRIRENPFHMNIFVEEIGTTPNSTGSQLFVDGRPFCFVLEDGYRETKVLGETRIPAGRYQVVKHTAGKFFTKYKKDFGHDFALHIKDVPGFEWVLIHIGNTVSDTRGCLLVNRNIGITASPRDYCGTDSGSVYKLLYMLIKAAYERGEEVWIEISRREVIDENTPVG